MKREDLKKLGLEDEAIDKIMDLHGKSVETHKNAAKTAQAELKTAQDQLKEANDAIEGFKKLDVDGIQKAADEWKTKYEAAQAEAAAQMDKLKFDHALESALRDANVRNEKAVKALLTTEDIELLKDGTLNGLDKQLETLKSDPKSDFLFESENDDPQIVTNTSNTKVPVADSFAAAAFRGANLTPSEGK